ncbi:MAG: sugar ABC transporter permease [Lentisphaeria bacterium]|nr:sugar ABC transporter permease [Lentisphaeria bacterium]
MPLRTQTRQNLTGLGFVAPWLVALAVFIGYPFLAGLTFSFCDFPPLKGPLFIGTENYAELLRDPVFHRTLGVTLVYASVSIPLGVLLALTLALLLNSRIRGLAFYRVVFYLPHLVPTVVVALLWLWIFNPKFGILNLFLGAGMGAARAWTDRFFDLEAAGRGVLACRWWALALPTVPGILFCVSALPWRVGAGGGRNPVRLWLRVAAWVSAGLACVSVLVALGYRFLPRDMEKLASPGWLSDAASFPSVVPFAPAWALWAIVIMGMWGVGQMAVIYLAKLQDVPFDLYEAADMDGASWWQKTRHITVPLISPVILFNVVMAIIGTFQIFAEPYIMTRGGPEDKTRFVAMFIYDQAFQYQRVGYASAVAWVLFLMIVALTLVAFRVSRRHVYYAGR